MADVEHFVSGLKAVLKITKDAPFLVEARSGKLYMASHNDFHSVIYECPTNWKDFKFVLSADVAKQLPQQIREKVDLLIDTVNNKVTLKSKGVKLNLNTLDKDSLSLTRLVKHFQKDMTWTVDGDVFKGAFSLVKHAANDKEIGDIVLKGYHLAQRQDAVELMASNGAMLAVTDIPAEGKVEDEVLLLNQEFDVAASLMFSNLRIGYNDKAVSMESKDDGRIIRTISALTTGNAFPYRTVIESAQKANLNHYEFDKGEFRDALKKLSFFMNADTKYKIKVTVGSDRIELETSNLYGKSQAQVRILDANQDEPLEFYISGENLLKYLQSTPAKTVTLYINDNSSPVYFEDGISVEVLVLFDNV